MKDCTLPYICIDDEYEYNLAVLLLIIDKLAVDNKGNCILNFDKIHVFMYLIKNPFKINRILEISGKNYTNINECQIYTIESMSVNFDILFDRSRVKDLVRGLAAFGVIESVMGDNTEILFRLNDAGKNIASELSGGYFTVIVELIENIRNLASIKSNKLFNLVISGV